MKLQLKNDFDKIIFQGRYLTMKRTALYAGSFDPVTSGHLNIIKRAACMYDELTVGVINNINKKSLFSLDERVEIISKALEGLDNIKIDTFDGLLADYVNDNGFDVVVRGLRATTDFEYEIQMAQMNDRLFTGKTETVFLMTAPEYSFISSSLIKEVASLGGDIDGLVPDFLIDMIKAKYKLKQ